MKICQSRKSTHSVMNHPHFGELKVIENGICFTVPNHELTKKGKIKARALERIHNCLTLDSAMYLIKYGYEITKA